LWVGTRLTARWAEYLARRGEAQAAFMLLSQADRTLAEGQRSSSGALIACIEELEATKRWLEVATLKTPRQREAAASELVQEYETSIRLRREGFKPRQAAEWAAKMGNFPELRPVALRLLNLAAD